MKNENDGQNLQPPAHNDTPAPVNADPVILIQIPPDDNGGEHQIVEPEVAPQRNTGLEDFLKKKSDGKIILKAYKESLAKKVPLKRTIRSRLVRLVIGREKDAVLKNITEDEVLEKFIIKQERFQLLADKIAIIFKGENSATYFSSYMKSGDKSMLANGKLWHHYNYVKFCLRRDQLLRQKASKQPKSALTEEELEPINGNENIVWLSTHLEPWNEVVDKWTASFAERRILLAEENLSVHDYIERFPCLAIQTATELFTIDFNLLHADKEFVSADEWTKIKTFLISCFDDINTKNCEDSIFIELMKTRCLTAEKEDFLVFYLLCHIIKPKRNGKRKSNDKDNRAKKLSLQERRETFILIVETANDIHPRLLDLKERHMQNSQSFQPVIVAVGAVTQIKKYHVVVNKKLFDANSVLEAIELALRIFFSLDCNYPENSKTIWTFLQKAIFDVHCAFDTVTVESNVLLGQIRNL